MQVMIRCRNWRPSSGSARPPASGSMNPPCSRCCTKSAPTAFADAAQPHGQANPPKGRFLMRAAEQAGAASHADGPAAAIIVGSTRPGR